MASCCLVDAAHVLSPRDSAEIDHTLQRLKDSTRFNVAVVTLPTVGDYSVDEVALEIG